MKNRNHIFSEDVEIPDIVMQKAETAFSEIQLEDKVIMMNDQTRKHNRKKKGTLKTQAAVIAGICILTVGSVSAVAAIHHYWGRGMQGTIQATDEQQQTLTNQGIASVLTEQENYSDLAVTSGNVTITPDTVIADDKFAYVSFSVKGYTIEDGTEPGFESIETYLGENPKADDGQVNMGASFYNGIVCDETGGPEYDDGSPIEYSEDGSIVSRYVNAEGNLEYVVMLSVTNYDDSLLSKTLHVNFENLGTLHKAEYFGAIEGTWDFTIHLPKVSAATSISVGKDVDGTNFSLDSVEISPISIKMNYHVNGKVNMKEDENGVPDFCGVVLKDGTRLPYVANGGMTGYTDDAMTSAYTLSAFDRVIEEEQVEALLVRTEEGSDMTEISIR